MLILLFGYGVYWYFYKTSFYLAGTDYSKIQWRTFYGKKTQGYLPEFQVTYSTDRNYGIKHKSEFEHYDEQNLVFCPIFSKFFYSKQLYPGTSIELYEYDLGIKCDSPDNVSNYCYYKKDMNNWFLFKYENLQSPSVPEDAGDNFIVKTDYIRKLKRAILRMS